MQQIGLLCMQRTLAPLTLLKKKKWIFIRVSVATRADTAPSVNSNSVSRCPSLRRWCFQNEAWFLKPCANHYCVIGAMSLWNQTNRYCAIVIIIPQLNLPALYAETIELIPTRKWQLVMWGKMDFTMLWCCKGPWDNTVNTLKRRLNWILCEMCDAWIKAYWSVVRCKQLCCTHVSLHAHRRPESDNIMYWFISMNCIHIWSGWFSSTVRSCKSRVLLRQ